MEDERGARSGSTDASSSTLWCLAHLAFPVAGGATGFYLLGLPGLALGIVAGVLLTALLSG